MPDTLDRERVRKALERAWPDRAEALFAEVERWFPAGPAPAPRCSFCDGALAADRPLLELQSGPVGIHGGGRFGPPATRWRTVESAILFEAEAYACARCLSEPDAGYAERILADVVRALRAADDDVEPLIRTLERRVLSAMCSFCFEREAAIRGRGIDLCRNCLKSLSHAPEPDETPL